MYVGRRSTQTSEKVCIRKQRHGTHNAEEELTFTVNGRTSENIPDLSLQQNSRKFPV